MKPIEKRAVPMSPLTIFLSVAFGVLFALFGATSLFVLAIGRFDEGRDAVAVSAIVWLLLSAGLFALPLHRRLGMILGGIALLLFASGMLWAVFNPGRASATPGAYQAAAIALMVLLLARLGLGLRRKSGPGQG